jgi:hypothetical protein
VLTQYIVDPAELPWKASQTQGINFQCQVLLNGLDGGPEALRFRFDPCPSVYAHMHLTSQFQLLLRGTMDFPKQTMKLRPTAVHYTDHNVPYGPFSVGAGHEVVVLHPKRGGLISMADKTARKQIYLQGREFTGMEKDIEWFSIPGCEGARSKILIPRAAGPEVAILQWPPHAKLSLSVPTYGRYEMVLDGSVAIGGRYLESPGFRYVQGDEQPASLQTGPDGATLIFLSFDKDALEGGLTGEGLAIAAEEAMARAI